MAKYHVVDNRWMKLDNTAGLPKDFVGVRATAREAAATAEQQAKAEVARWQARTPRCHLGQISRRSRLARHAPRCHLA